ncbi:MAG: class I SAM-dependent methyltransferase [Candidatus Levyibacteriota bacterium]
MTNRNLVLEKTEEYELLDSGGEQKLERYGQYVIARPEKQALWKKSHPDLWERADATYIRTTDKFGEWKTKQNIPNEWIFNASSSFKMKLKLTPFGHVGIFPELKSQWDWIQNITQNSPSPKVLSLFSYTGAATLAAAAAGALVTHVDASKPAISWAVENQKLSGLEPKPIRWIVDDALKFIKREERRGNIYDGIIMDPPKFGRGPKGEVWQFEEDFPELMESCTKILAKNPLFFLVTAYTVPISPITLTNMTADILPNKEKIEFGEITIKESESGRQLPTSIYARWNA